MIEVPVVITMIHVISWRRLPDSLRITTPLAGALSVIGMTVLFASEWLPAISDELSRPFWASTYQRAGLNIFAWAIFGLLAGGWTVRFLQEVDGHLALVNASAAELRRPSTADRRKSSLQSSFTATPDGSRDGQGLSRRVTMSLLCFGAAIVGASLVGNGPGALWSRDMYLNVGLIPPLKSAVGPFLPLSALLLSAVVARGYGKTQRRMALIFFSVLLLILFASGSRQVALALLVAAFVQAAFGRQHLRWLSVLVCAISATFLLPTALALRSLPHHGLKFYVPEIANAPKYLLDQGAGALSGILFTVPLAGATSILRSHEIRPTIGVSLNPAPSSIAGWDVIASHARFNAYIPYSALGELATVGPLAVFAFMAAAGFILAILGVLMRRNAWPSLLIVALPLSLGGIFLFVAAEYNLRSSCRYLYLSLILAVLASVVRFPDIKLGRRTASPEISSTPQVLGRENQNVS